VHDEAASEENRLPHECELGESIGRLMARVSTELLVGVGQAFLWCFG
jgi:hypothetical protein